MTGILGPASRAIAHSDSLGGLTRKVHLVSSGPLSRELTAGDVNGATMRIPVLDAIRIPRAGPWRPHAWNESSRDKGLPLQGEPRLRSPWPRHPFGYAHS